MPRTTLDIDATILKEIKALGKRGRLSLGKLVSRLLAEAIARRKSGDRAQEFRWVSRPMGVLVELADKEAVYGVLDRRKDE